MSKHKAHIMLSLKLPSGDWRYRHPAPSRNGRIRPFYALVDGEAKHHPEANYVLQYREDGKLRYEPLGTSDPAELAAAQQRKELLLRARADGLVVLGPPPAPDTAKAIRRPALKPVPEPVPEVIAASTLPPRTAADLIHEFLEETRRLRKPKTLDAYSATLKPFRNYLREKGRENLQEVTREDVLVFLGVLANEHANAPRTLRNKYEVLKRLFLHFGLVWVMKDKKDKPRYTKKRVTVYKERELQALFQATTLEEYELFQFFLATGGREQDVMYAAWTDVDWDDRLYLIQQKEIDGGGSRTWDPKDREEAGIPIPDSLLDLLRRRRERYPASRWIFPAQSGEPEGHFLRKLKALALQAGLNCGTCSANLDSRPVRCDRHPVCHKWTLHKFRRTFATMHHQAGVPVRTISHWLRHSDLETTLRYLAAIEYTDKETRQKVNATFARLTRPHTLAHAS